MLAYTSKYWNMIMPLAKKGLAKRYGRAYTKALLQKATLVYRALLSRADDVGKDNPMASNIYEALIFFAIWEAADGKLTTADLRALVNEVMDMPLLKLVDLFINLNKPSDLRKYSNMMKKNDAWLQAHPQYREVSWDF